MKKTLKLLAIILVIALIMPFTRVNATITRTEKVVESLKEIIESFNGRLNYENDTIEIEWETQNSQSSEIVFSYNENIIEYDSGEITSYEEAEEVTRHSIFAVNLIESALRVNGYTDEQIQKFLTSEDSEVNYEVNGIELKQTGEAKKFTSEDGLITTTVSPILIKIDVTRANTNKADDDIVTPKETTIEDIVKDLQTNEDFTTTKYEDKVVYENEIYNDDDTITIFHTYFWEDYHNVYFACEDDTIFYDDEEIEDYYDAERALSYHMFANQILTIALKENGYTIEQIQEFFSSEDNELDYELNGIELKETGNSREYTSSDGSSTLTVTPMSIKIDLLKANLNKANEEESEQELQQKEYTVDSNTNSGDSISFEEREGEVYSFSIIDRLATTDEDLQKIVDLFNDPEYTFDALKEQLNKLIGYGKNAAGDKGTLLKLYEVYLTNNGIEVHEVSGGFKIKLKITDDMKGYDSYKLIYIADDGTTEDAIELTNNGEYLEGTLPHLSIYALVGSKTEAENEDKTETKPEVETEDKAETKPEVETEDKAETKPEAETKATTDTNKATTATTKSNNPKTGDNIIIIFSIFAIATLGVFITIKFNKNSK